MEFSIKLVLWAYTMGLLVSSVGACPVNECRDGYCHIQCKQAAKEDKEDFKIVEASQCVRWHLAAQWEHLKQCKKFSKICYCKLGTLNKEKVKRIYPTL